MRFAGLTLCLIVSTLSARAESLEDRVAALEARMKTLEETLLQQGAAFLPAEESETEAPALQDTK